MTDYEPLEVFSDIYYDKVKNMFPNMNYHEILLYVLNKRKRNIIYQPTIMANKNI